MTIELRTAIPDTDYVRIAEIMQTYERQPVTADILKEWDGQIRPGTIWRRTVAVDENKQIVGYGAVIHHAWMEDGLFSLWVITDPAKRGQGIGRQLYDHTLAFARQNSAQKLHSDVLDNDEIGQQFAEKRGFTVRRHLFESTINLREGFDESPFAGVIEGVEASGIRLFSLADAGNTETALRKLWEVNYQVSLDDPASTGTFPNFEEFQQITSGGKWFRPEGQILAADGDRYVGLSAVGYYADSNSAYNMMTGVMPDYRGRKIALALKLMTIRVAQTWGVDFIRANNDSQNGPMLAINRKLGYQKEIGAYHLLKTMDD